MKFIEYKNENGILTLLFPERIDTANATDVESEISEAEKSAPVTSCIINAERMVYTSSSGLRIILRLAKRIKDTKIINVSSEVYEIFDMTGFAEMLTIEKAFRHLSVDGCPILGQGAKGTVYRYNNDTIVKVFKRVDCLDDIKNERELARKAFVLGIPTAISYDIVKVGEKYGSVFELLEARTYSDLFKNDTANFDKYSSEFASLLRLIHGTKVRPEDMPDFKIKVRKWLDKSSAYLSEEETKKISSMIDAVPDTYTMIHGDYHTNNVMLQNGETLLIDMDTLSHGHPIFEVGNVYACYVLFPEAIPDNLSSFFDLPDDCGPTIWDSFIRKYLGTDDTEKISDVTEKAKLIACLRVINHMTKHGDGTERSACEKIASYIHTLLEKLDSLSFEF